MSLIPFHRGLIATAIVFCFGFAGWEAVAYARGAGGGALALAIVFAFLGVALAYYLRRLARFLGYEDADRRTTPGR